MANGEGLYFYRFEGSGQHYEEMGRTISVSEPIHAVGNNVQFLRKDTVVVYEDNGGTQHTLTVDVERTYCVSHEPQTSDSGEGEGSE